MALRSYVTEEIVQDCADGLLSRREALRRVALRGVRLPVAGSLLAACADDDKAATPPPASSSGSAPPPANSAAQLITFPGTTGDLQAAFAPATQPKGAVLVIHENRGLTPHFHDL